MRNRRLLALLSVTVALVLGGLLWFRPGDAPPAAGAAITPGERPGLASPAPPGSTDTGLELGTPRSAPTELRRDDLSSEAPAAPAAPASEDAGVDLATARWIEVQLRVPGPGTGTASAGAAGDDSLRVLAIAADDGHGELLTSLRDSLAGRRIWRLQHEALARQDKVAWSRRPLEGGLARLPLPAEATRAYLFVDGRFLYLDEPFELELEPDPGRAARATVDASLGAHATVRWELPHGAAERGVRAGEFAGQLTVQGTWMFRRNARGRPVTYEFDLAADDPLELRGIPAGTLMVVAASIEGLAPYREPGLRFEAGEERALEVAFTLGGELRGLVVDAQGAPVVGASVRPAASNPMMMFTGRVQAAETTTDAEGRFRLLGVAPGQAALEVSATGWVDGGAENIEVADGEVVSGIEVVLERGASLSGRVVFPDGRPAGGASVEVRGTRAGRGPWQGEQEVGETESDDEGRFVVQGLPQGRLDVVARLGREPQAAAGMFPLLESDESEAEDVGEEAEGWWAAAREVAAGAEGLELVLGQLRALRGHVRDDRGAAIADFRVRARPAESSNARWNVAGRIEEVVADSEDGAFEIWGLHAGDWEIEASAEGFAPSEGSQAAVQIPLEGDVATAVELVLSRAAALAGRVVDPSGRPAKARVIASTGERQGWWDGGGERAEAGSDGRFELEGLPVGTLTVHAESDDWGGSAPLSVELEPSQRRDDLVLQLRVGGRVTGDVFDGEGRPDAGRRVTYSASAMGGGVFGNGPSAITDEAGFFAFEHVTPGTWIVSAGPSEERTLEILSNARDQSGFMEMFSKVDTATVEVVDGSEVHLTLGAEPLVPVRVRGRVRRSGEAVGEAQVIAIAEGGSLLKGMKMATTGRDGSFETTVDRPGAYVFTVATDGRASQVEFQIDVPEVEQHTIELVLPTGAIEGTVTDPEGEPAVGVRLSLTSEGESSRMRMGGGGEAETDDQGRYRFDGLREGPYTVRCGAFNAFGFGAQATYGTAIASGIQVDADETTRGADLQLSRPASVKGTVRDEAGEAVAGATIFVRDELGRLLSTISGTVTNAAGKFEYSGVSPGVVTVSARAGEGASPDSAPVRIRENEAAQVSLTLATATLLIVEVVDDDGEPLRARVRVFDEREFEVGNMLTLDSMQTLFAEGISSRESRIGPLPPGKYRVEAQGGDGNSTKKPVTLKGQDERRVKLRLKE